MGLCILNRHKGQFIKLRDPKGKVYEVCYEGFNDDYIIMSIDKRKLKVDFDGEFYIDKNEIALCVVVKHGKGGSGGFLKIGIDAPKSWDIARGEIPFS